MMTSCPICNRKKPALTRRRRPDGSDPSRRRLFRVLYDEWIERKEETGVSSAFFGHNYHSLLLSFPELRAYWPMSSADENNDIHDLSGQNHALTNNNAATFGLTPTFIPYIQLNGTDQFLTSTDPALDFRRSMAFLFWIYLDSIPTAPLTARGVVSAWDETTNQRSFRIHINRVTDTTARLYFAVSLTGADAYQISNANQDLTVGKWYHVAAMRLGPTGSNYSTKLYVNTIGNAGGVAAAILHNTTAPFTIGRYIGATESRYLHGRIAMFSAYDQELSVAALTAHYNFTRRFFE